MRKARVIRRGDMVEVTLTDAREFTLDDLRRHMERRRGELKLCQEQIARLSESKLALESEIQQIEALLNATG